MRGPTRGSASTKTDSVATGKSAGDGGGSDGGGSIDWNKSTAGSVGVQTSSVGSAPPLVDALELEQKDSLLSRQRKAQEIRSRLLAVQKREQDWRERVMA